MIGIDCSEPVVIKSLNLYHLNGSKCIVSCVALCFITHQWNLMIPNTTYKNPFRCSVKVQVNHVHCTTMITGLTLKLTLWPIYNFLFSRWTKVCLLSFPPNLMSAQGWSSCSNCSYWEGPLYLQTEWLDGGASPLLMELLILSKEGQSNNYLFTDYDLSFHVLGKKKLMGTMFQFLVRK